MAQGRRALAAYTDDELLEELVRRRNARAEKSPRRWCHDCLHFKVWKRPGESPDSYNPCAKAHSMQFVMPEEIDDEYGYFRKVCGDRAALPKPPPDLPAPRPALLSRADLLDLQAPE